MTCRSRGDTIGGAQVTTSRTRRASAPIGAGRIELLGVELSRRVTFPEVGQIEPGRTAAEWVRVPTEDAQRLLREVARLVADLPRESSRDVVWTLGSSELLLHTDQLTIAISTGLVAIGIPVECDQADPATISVPLAVGTTKQVRGLFASTLDAPVGPPVITGIWADALAAFAYECLVTLAQHIAAQAGKDPAGRVLVPAAVAAERGLLLVKSMARNGV